MIIVPTNLLLGLQKIKEIPDSAIWMLAVDGKFFSKDKGPCVFDKREPGSVQGILNGFITALQQLNTKSELTVEMLQHIHKSCVQGIKTQNPANPGVVRTTPVAFEIMPGWASLEGLKNLIEKGYVVCRANVIESTSKAQLDRSNPLKLDNFEHYYKLASEKKIKLFYLPPNSEKLESDLTSSITRYNSLITWLKESKKDFNPDIPLIAIAELIQNLTRTHAFRDGNNRTYVNCLLNALLVNNGFTAAIFYDPNLFEFHTITELLEIIKAAMEANERIAANPDTTLFDFNLSEMTVEHERYITMGRDFLLEIDRMILEAPRPAEGAYLIKHYTKPTGDSSLMFKQSKEIESDGQPREGKSPNTIKPPVLLKRSF
jgi:hypothetical protein